LAPFSVPPHRRDHDKEADVCVLSTVLGAVNRATRGDRDDARCSSYDETLDASIPLYENRYGEEVEAVTTAIILENWT
jgi:hypothetical protein